MDVAVVMNVVDVAVVVVVAVVAVVAVVVNMEWDLVVEVDGLWS